MNSKPSTILAFAVLGVLLAAGAFAPVASPAERMSEVSWTSETGFGTSVPACASAVSYLTTCNEGVAQATISWTDPDGGGALVNLDVCEGSWCPLIVYTPAGMFNGAGWDSFTLPAAGEVVLSPLKNNTTYVYALRDTHGTVVAYPTFTTPTCGVAIPLRCTPSSQSVDTGQTASFTADFGAGTTYTWSAPGGNPATGSSPARPASFSTSYATAGPYDVTVTDALGVQTTCSVGVTAPAPDTCTASFSPSSGTPGSPTTANWSSPTLPTSGTTANSFACPGGSLGSGPLPSGNPGSFTLPGGIPADQNNCTLTMNAGGGRVATCNASVGPPGGSGGAPTVSCSPSRTSATIGDSVTWSASPSGFSGSPTFSWSGDVPLAGKTGSPVTVQYSSSGTKSGSVTAVSGSQSATNACQASVSVSPASCNPPVGSTCNAANSCGYTSNGHIQSNCACNAIPPSEALCSGASRPDYIAQGVTINPSSGYAQETAFTVRATITNNGAPASASVSTIAGVCYWPQNLYSAMLASDPYYFTNYPCSGDPQTVPALTNSGAPSQVNLTFPSFTPSYSYSPYVWYAIVCADAGNQILENAPSGEDNNCSLTTFMISPARLVTSLTATPNSGPEPLPVSLRADAQGTAIGPTVDYRFWWNCANTTTDVATAESACGPLPGAATEIIVDNAAPGVSDATHSFNGTWYDAASSGLSGIPYGGNSLNSSDSSARYRFTPAISSGGNYTVYLSWQSPTFGGFCGSFGGLCGAAQSVTVMHAGVSNTISLDVKNPSNGWQSIGNYTFDDRGPAFNYIEIVEGSVVAPGYSGPYGNADGVRLVPAVGACISNAAGATCAGVQTNYDPDTGAGYNATLTNHTYNAAGSPFTAKVITSSNGLNRQAQATVTVFSSLVDLNIRDPFVAGDGALAGSVIGFGGNVYNMGYSNAPNSQTRLRIDIGNNGWSLGEPELALVPTGTILPVTSSPFNIFYARWLSFMGTGWTSTCGSGTCTHSYQICADSTNVVSESNEINNCSPATTFTVTAPPQCSDGIDNDGDGKTDYPSDPGCSSAIDNDEFNAPLTQCRDGIDNDGDGLIDHSSINSINPDPGCLNINDNDERNNPTFEEVAP